VLLIVRVKQGYLLDCWLSGGKHYVVEPPCMPYFWNLTGSFGGEPHKRRLLSKPTEDRTIYKIICDTVYDVRRRRVQGISIESDVRFIERLAIDYGFKQPDMRLSLLAFDVEAFSKGQFPRADRDALAALAVCSPRVQKCFVGDERDIIIQFIEVVERENPDVLATYSGTAFDYEFTLARARRAGLRLALGRLRDEPSIHTREYAFGKRIGVDKSVFLHGRVCFDVYQEVRWDAALSGVRRDLKSVARYFYGDEYVREVDRSRIGKLSESELYDYCFSDARLTYLLAEHYLSVLKTLAFMLHVPLDFIVHRSPSHIGNVIYGRRFKQLGIVSDGANVDRFRGVLW